MARDLGEVFQHRRTLISLPGQDFNDLVFLGSHQPISLAPDNEPPLYAWL